MRPFKVGDKVFRGNKQGVVNMIFANGDLSVTYSDGTIEDGVPSEHFKKSEDNK